MDTQPVKERQVTRIPEEFQQTIGNAVADLGNSDEFVETCGFQVVQVSEVSGQFAGDSFSYITDAQAKKNSLKGHLLRFFNAIEQIANRSFSKASPGKQGLFFGCKIVNVGNIVQQDI